MDSLFHKLLIVTCTKLAAQCMRTAKRGKEAKSPRPEGSRHRGRRGGGGGGGWHLRRVDSVKNKQQVSISTWTTERRHQLWQLILSTSVFGAAA